MRIVYLVTSKHFDESYGTDTEEMRAFVSREDACNFIAESYAEDLARLFGREPTECDLSRLRHTLDSWGSYQSGRTYYSIDKLPLRWDSREKVEDTLSSAAQDMYDALFEAVEKYGKPGGPWNVPGDPGSWIDKAKKALAKARGEERTNGALCC